jgi:hypothetical protein
MDALAPVVIEHFALEGVAERRAQILKLAPSSLNVRLTGLHIVLAQRFVDRADLPLAEKGEQPFDSARELLRPSERLVDRANTISQVSSEDVEDGDLRGRTAAIFVDGGFSGEVLGKPFFSLLAVASAASSPDLFAFVDDDPDSAFAISRWPEPEAGGLGWIRHNSLMRSILVSVE